MKRILVSCLVLGTLFIATTRGSGTIVLNFSNSGASEACFRYPNHRQCAWLGRRLRHAELFCMGDRSRIRILPARVRSACRGRPAAKLMRPQPGPALLRFKSSLLLSATAPSQKNGRRSATWAGKPRSWPPAPFTERPTASAPGTPWARPACTSALIFRIPSKISDRRINTSRQPSAQDPLARTRPTSTRS